MYEHDAFVPNNEQETSLITNIQASNALGKSTGSLQSIGSLTPARKLGQSAVGVFPNVGNGNLYIEDHQIAVDDGGWQFNLGMVFNSQGEPRWRFNLGKRIKSFADTQIRLTLDDGAEINFTSVNGTDFTAQTPLGNFELTKKTDGSFILLQPGSGISSHFSNDGFEQRREDAAGVGIDFHYTTQGQLAQVLLPSGRSLQWVDQPVTTGTTLSLVLCDKKGKAQQNLCQYQFGANQTLQKTRIALNSQKNYDINYAYDPKTNDLIGVSQTDQTSVSFSYAKQNGKKKFMTLTMGSSVIFI